MSLPVFLLLISEKSVLGHCCVLLDVYVYSQFGWVIGASCQNPFQPFQPKIRTEHFLHFLQQLQQVCFACMWQFKMFSRNYPFSHFCHFPNISFTAGDTGCVFLQSRVVRAHVCTCLHNIFQHRQNKEVVQISAHCELHGLLAPRRATGSQIGNCKEWSVSFPPDEGGTKSSIWRIVNKCQKYILCRQA